MRNPENSAAPLPPWDDSKKKIAAPLPQHASTGPLSSQPPSGYTVPWWRTDCSYEYDSGYAGVLWYGGSKERPTSSFFFFLAANRRWQGFSYRRGARSCFANRRAPGGICFAICCTWYAIYWYHTYAEESARNLRQSMQFTALIALP